MDNKILPLMFGLIFMLSFTSAIELNPFAQNVKNHEINIDIDKTDLSDFIKQDFNKEYGVIKFSKSIFWIPTDKVAEYSLTKVEDSVINAYAEGKAVLYSKGRLFDDVNFKDTKGDLKELRDVQYYIWVEENYTEQEPVYETVCDTTKITANETNQTSCEQVIKEYKNITKTKSYWKPYNYEILDAGNYPWKLEAKRNYPNQAIDFIPTAQGKQLDEWAWWNSNWKYKRPIDITANAGKFSYLATITYDSDMQADFDDLRFVNNAETTEFNYTIESYTASTSARVRIYSQGETNFYMYYGNPTVSTTSSASNTHFNPVSYYYLDEASGTTAYDSVGTNHGTINGTTINQAGKIEKGYKFTNSSRVLIGTGLNSLFNYNKEFSICIWLNNTNYMSDKLAISTYTPTTGQFATNIEENSEGKIVFNICKSGIACVSSSEIVKHNLNEWNFYCGTYNPGTNESKLYKNGAFQNSGIWNLGTPVEPTGNFFLGNAGIGSSTISMNAIYDEVIIYNRALTSTEISALYNYTAPNFVTGDEEEVVGRVEIDFVTPPTETNNSFIGVNYFPIEVDVNYTNSTIENITYYLYNSDLSLNTSQTYETETYEHNFTGLSDGTYLYNVTIYANESKTDTIVNDSTETRYINIDVLPPVLNITSPLESYDYLYDNQTIDLNFTALDDGVGLDSCWFEYLKTGKINTTIEGSFISEALFDDWFYNSSNITITAGTNATWSAETLFTKEALNGISLEINTSSYLSSGASANGPSWIRNVNLYIYNYELSIYELVDSVEQLTNPGPGFFNANVNYTKNVIDDKYITNGRALFKYYIKYYDTQEMGWTSIAQIILNKTTVKDFHELNCSENTTFNYIAGVNNLTLYANDTLGNENSLERSWDVKVVENSRTHNTSSYITAYENYQINVTASSSLTGVGLLFNGTDYSMTSLGSGVWSYSRDLPVATIGNNSIAYRFTYAGDTINSDLTTYQNIANTTFVLCGGAYTNDFLNISFKDESDLSSINASLPLSEFEYYLGSGTVTKTYQLVDSTENYYYDFCASPTDRTLNVIPYVQYKQGTSYPQRIWNPSVTAYNSTVVNQTLYLLGTADGIYVTFQVLNTADQTITGVEINAVREISGSDVVVGTGTTGADGGVTLWLNPDFVHTFTLSKDGFDTQSTSFAPTQSSYTFYFGGAVDQTTSYTKGINYNIIPTNISLTNDTIYEFGFNLTSSFWDLDEYGFSLRLNNGTVIAGDTTTVSGELVSIDFNTTDTSKIYMDYYWTINSTNSTGTRAWNVYNTENTQWSISVFFTDLNSYMDSGLFGLDDFGRYLIVFIILFLSVGIMSYKYGFVSPMAITTLTFAIIFFLDVVVGLIPPITMFGGTTVNNLLTIVAGIILVITILTEVKR